MSYDHTGHEHEKAAKALCDKMGWSKPGRTLLGGGFPDGTMVWAFDDTPYRVELNPTPTPIAMFHAIGIAIANARNVGGIWEVYARDDGRADCIVRGHDWAWLNQAGFKRVAVVTRDGKANDYIVSLEGREMNYQVKIVASDSSVYANDAIKRTYLVDAPNYNAAQAEAIRKGCVDDNLSHVRVLSTRAVCVYPKCNCNSGMFWTKQADGEPFDQYIKRRNYATMQCPRGLPKPE